MIAVSLWGMGAIAVGWIALLGGALLLATPHARGDAPEVEELGR